jgi:hypothetical protein
VGERGHDAGSHVEDQVAHVPEAVLDVVAEDPEEEHVAAEVEQAAVEEHRRHHREQHVLGREHRRPAAAVVVAGGAVALRERVPDLLDAEGAALHHLTGDGGLLEVEGELPVDLPRLPVDLDLLDLAACGCTRKYTPTFTSRRTMVTSGKRRAGLASCRGITRRSVPSTPAATAGRAAAQGSLAPGTGPTYH